jgi:SAM-dependent methyltransferase
MLSHYSLGATDSELHRLVDLASHEEHRVIEACRRVGIGAGATVLDLGCGPLGGLAALARIVGRDGLVIGVDASGPALEKARSILPLRDFPNIRLLQADVNEGLTQIEGLTPTERPKSEGVTPMGAPKNEGLTPTADLARNEGLTPAGNPRNEGLTPTGNARSEGLTPVIPAGADLAYSRLMLLHQADPARTLGRMAALLRPGGVVIAHEPSDLPVHAPASEPAVPAMTRVWELVIAAAQARGAHTDFGRRGRAYLEAAGFAIESGGAYTVHYPPAVGYEIPRVALQSLRPTLAQHGLAEEKEIARLDRELEEAKHRADVQWVSSPLMFEWIGRKRS